MHLVRPDLKKISIITIVLFLVLYTLVQLLFDIEFTKITASITKTGTILTLIGVFWAFFNKTGWKVGFLRLGGWLCSTPDLNGRWEGTVCRTREDMPHPFVIEVIQTYSTITYKTFSSQSRGESMSATIHTDESEEVFTLYSIWRTSTKRRDDPNAEDEFTGASVWNIRIGQDEKIIEYNYFTGREPQTKGDVKVKWISHRLRNGFQ